MLCFLVLSVFAKTNSKLQGAANFCRAGLMGLRGLTDGVICSTSRVPFDHPKSFSVEKQAKSSFLPCKWCRSSSPLPSNILCTNQTCLRRFAANLLCYRYILQLLLPVTLPNTISYHLMGLPSGTNALKRVVLKVRPLSIRRLGVNWSVQSRLMRF